MKKLCLTGFVLSFAIVAHVVRAEELKPEVVVEGLHNPTGVAIQPKTNHVFIADSGNLRVVRVNDGQVEDVIVGFPKDVWGQEPAFDIGPLGLLFLDQDTLIVGGGGLPDGDELLRVYEVPAAGSEPIQADAMKASFALPATDGAKGQGNFYGLALNKDAIFVTTKGDETKGWIAKATVSGSKLIAFDRSIATREAVHVAAPVGITISPRGEIVVGQMGDKDTPHDSLLSFYRSKDGKLLLNLETGLHDITALAYSPQGQLYATDFAWLDPAQGGLFQLIAKRRGDEPAVEAKKIASLDKPTALAFGPDGSLYITVISEPNQGKLLKIAPGL